MLEGWFLPQLQARLDKTLDLYSDTLIIPERGFVEEAERNDGRIEKEKKISE